MHRTLFLLGGSDAFDVTADEFIPAAGGRDANIALLLQGGEKSNKHAPEYIRPWQARGAARYQVIVPDENGKLDFDQASAQLASETGVFIGGGNTAIYRRLYATGAMRDLLRECYRRGVPIAGCSAGALIAPEICAFHPGESDNGSLVAQGLGLISGMLLGVHFTSRDTLPNVVAAMAETRTANAWGIDDCACLVFEDEQFKRVLGHSAYQITMTDFERKLYDIHERTRL
jgi:cyanophycinase